MKKVKIVLGIMVGLYILSAFCWAVEVNEGMVYYGDVSNYKKPAYIELGKVLQAIPAYKELLRTKYASSEPEYWMLLNDVSSQLISAFKRINRKQGYDLIGEKGFIEGEKIPDITSQIIEFIQKEE